MVKPNTPMLLTTRSQQGLVEFFKQCNMASRDTTMRANMENIDRAYQRELDITKEHNRAKLANRYGDPTRFQNITVPIILPQVEAAVTYQASVFLTGQPLFGVVSNPQSIDAAVQMETLIDSQATRGGWVGQLIMALRDGFKYNLFAVECKWDQIAVATLDTDPVFSTKEARPKETIWEGNMLRRLDLYNSIFDKRCPISEMHTKGDFAGYTEIMTRTQLKSFINKLPNVLKDNVKTAFESGLGGSATSTNATESYYIPVINPTSIADPNTALKGGTNWLTWVGMATDEIKIQYKDIYEVSTIYARVIPSDFSMTVPSKNTPQIWKLVVVNGQVLIYAERQTNAHNWLPIIFGQPFEDGLNLQTKSLADNVRPIQEITSAIWNSAVASRRRAISDRGIYDPSRIDSRHINSDNPSAKIPVRPAAYGKNVAEAYYAIPYRDDQIGIIGQETQQLVAMADLISGQNRARQGQFVKGNKTQHEFDTVMNNANGRDQLVALSLESQFFMPLKEIIKINILQYQGATTLYNKETQTPVQIDPLMLRRAILEFKVSDGLIPSDKLISSDATKTALQVIGSSPQIAEEYNLGPLFSYFIKTQGGRISEFEKSQEQIAYERAVTQWQQTVLQIFKQNPQITQQQLPPQPTPQQFNYNPQNMMPNPNQMVNQPRVNNITNNITNAGAQ